MTDKGQMRLGAFFNPTGEHVASWGHPNAPADARLKFRHYLRCTPTGGGREATAGALARWARYIAIWEPLRLLAALSAVTSRIGLVATASTSYNEPFHVARKFASIEIGRAHV